MKPICGYCQNEAHLVTGEVIYPHRPDLHLKNFWRCSPCDAYVGCHAADIGYGDGTRPLGRLANAELRKAKSAAHVKFDRFWMSQPDRRGARKKAYAELARRLNIPVNDCHIGEFDVDQCKQVIVHTKSMVEQWKFWAL